MTKLLEQLIAWLWNYLRANKGHPTNPHSLDLGRQIIDGQTTSTRVVIAHLKRAEHIAVLGKTGTGKSTLLRFMATQDIQASRGFVFFDIHGDTTPVLLRTIAEHELASGQDLSAKVIIIEPADPDWSVGLNVLEQGTGQNSFVQIAEFAQILKQRWHLDSFGARTEELSRGSLSVLQDAGLTLLELARLLTDANFRAFCLRRTTNQEVREYFERRYNPASEGMQTMFRDAILNKVSAFTSDPHFRHILGQQRSTFSIVEAIDQGCWIFLNLDKGRLGEQSSTLGSLFLTKLKNALFSRRSRQLFSLYCDEIQNLLTFDSGIDTLLSEARKFSVGVISGNQFLDQYPPQMRSAIMAIGSHVFFQLSSNDADKIGVGIGGGRSLAELLKNLPQRHFVMKSGHHRAVQAVVPAVATPRTDYQDLAARSRARWARRRTEVEAEIRTRTRGDFRGQNQEVLRDWE